MSLVESLFRRTRQDLFVCRRMGLSVSKGRREGESTTCLSLCLLYEVEVEVEVDGRRDPSSCTHARRGLCVGRRKRASWSCASCAMSMQVLLGPLRMLMRMISRRGRRGLDGTDMVQVKKSRGLRNEKSHRERI